MTLDDRLTKAKGIILSPDDGSWRYMTDTTQDKLAILSDLLEIIGEDENSQVEEQYASPQPTVDEHYRNKLRQELREGVRKYCE